MSQGLLVLAAFVTSALLVSGFYRVARQRLLDSPGARSSHVRPTPTGGGIGALVAWVVVVSGGVWLGELSGGRWFLVAVLGGVVLGVTGLLDDLYDLRRTVRYAVQLCVAIMSVAVLGGPAVLEGWPRPLVLVGAVIVFTYLVNAFNFMDGIDALVSGTGSIILCFLAYFTSQPAWLVLAGAYAGFLIHNLPPAKLFMGDAGSTALGGLVSIALLTSGPGFRLEHLVVLGPLIGDSAYTLVRRALRGENIFKAHHSHIYQRLLRAGYRHGQVSAGYACATLLSGILVVLAGWRGGLAAVLMLGVVIVGAELYLGQRRVPFTRPS